MAKRLKTIEEPLTEEMFSALVGNFIHVPVNPFTNWTEENGEPLNAYFAGKVAGFLQENLYYDFKTNEFLENPEVTYTIVLTDGMAYRLSGQAEVEILQEEEFEVLVTEHLAQTALERETEAKVVKLIQPENRILLPGEDF